MKNLVEEHIKLADLCAKKWRARDSKIAYDDYYQEACVGLVIAAKRYKSHLKTKFSSYAFIVMDGAIKNMRAFWYTGYKEGFLRHYPVPTWVLLDHPYDHNPDTSDGIYGQEGWAEKHIGSYSHDYVLREELKTANLQVESMDETSRIAQQNTYRYIKTTKEFMKQNKISHNKLATMLGVTQPTITRWLNGTGLTTAGKKKIDIALYGNTA